MFLILSWLDAWLEKMFALSRYHSHAILGLLALLHFAYRLLACNVIVFWSHLALIDLSQFFGMYSTFSCLPDAIHFVFSGLFVDVKDSTRS